MKWQAGGRVKIPIETREDYPKADDLDWHDGSLEPENVLPICHNGIITSLKDPTFEGED